jgi:alanine dehydrogenase
VPLERMREADVIVTITSSPAASLMAAHVSPGTHLACMGTDTMGKQEVEPALLARATVFADEVAQSVSIGEAQHAVAAGLVDAGRHHAPGRRADRGASRAGAADEITLFDGTGVQAWRCRWWRRHRPPAWRRSTSDRLWQVAGRRTTLRP